MSDPVDARRRFLIGAGTAGAGMVLTAGVWAAEQRAKQGRGKEKEVGAVEDLMREHGVIRRALLVYRESATRLRSNASSVNPGQFSKTAKLFRTFGEDYRERKLEENYIFPMLRNAGGPAAAYVQVLITQRNRSREITEYILAVAGKGAIGTGDAEPLARVFKSFGLMYENHTAREDTIVFPAWKSALSERQLHEMGDKFKTLSASNSAETDTRMRSRKSPKSSKHSALPISPNSRRPHLQRRDGKHRAVTWYKRELQRVK